MISGTITPTALGTYSVPLPGTPTGAHLFASGKGNTQENDQARISTGIISSNTQHADAMLVNANGYFCRNYRSSDDKCIVVLGTPAGVLKRVLAIKHVSFTTNAWNFQVVDIDPDYQIPVSVSFEF